MDNFTNTKELSNNKLHKKLATTHTRTHTHAKALKQRKGGNKTFNNKIETRLKPATPQAREERMKPSAPLENLLGGGGRRPIERAWMFPDMGSGHVVSISGSCYKGQGR